MSRYPNQTVLSIQDPVRPHKASRCIRLSLRAAAGRRILMRQIADIHREYGRRRDYLDDLDRFMRDL